VHNDRLVDALSAQAFSALTASPGARTFYDHQRASGHGHNDALRRLANRLVGILHGCLKTRTLYDEDTAWDVYVGSNPTPATSKTPAQGRCGVPDCVSGYAARCHQMQP
jgi:hypothetical protein